MSARLRLAYLGSLALFGLSQMVVAARIDLHAFETYEHGFMCAILYGTESFYRYLLLYFRSAVAQTCMQDPGFNTIFCGKPMHINVL